VNNDSREESARGAEEGDWGEKDLDGRLVRRLRVSVRLGGGGGEGGRLLFERERAPEPSINSLCPCVHV
jgi:hypothetical protein